jgi:hypothetical protein
MFIADVTNFPDHHQISRTQNHPFIQQAYPRPLLHPRLQVSTASSCRFTMKPRVTAFVAGEDCCGWRIVVAHSPDTLQNAIFSDISRDRSSIVLHYPSLRADPQIPMEEVLQ